MIKKLLIALLSLLIALVLVLYFLLATQPGLDLSLAIAKKVVPGKLTIQKAQGSLAGPLKITQLNYQSQQINVAVKSINLNWAPATLLAGRLTVNKLRLDKPQIQTFSTPQTTEATKQAFSIPALPIQFTLHHLTVNDLSLQQGSNEPTLIQSAQLSASSSGKHIRIKTFHVISNPYTLTLKGKTLLDKPLTTSLSGTLINQTPHNKIIPLHFKLTGDLKKAKLQVNINKPFKAHLTAQLTQPLQQGPIEIEGQWQQVLWPLGPDNFINSPQGSMTVTGTLKNYHIGLKTQVAGTQIPEATINLNAEGDGQHLHIKQLTADLLGGQLTSQGNLSWQPDLKWQFVLHATHLNLHKKWSDWSSNLNLTALTRGQMTDTQSNLLIELKQLRGKLNGQPVQANALVKQHNDKLQVKQLTFHAGDNHLTVQGQLSQHSHLTWKAQLKNLEQLCPAFAGTLTSRGSLTGSVEKPVINTTIRGNKLVLPQTQIKQLAIKGRMNLNAYSNLSINSSGIQLNGQTIKQLSLKAQGTQKKHSATLSMTETNLGQLNVELHGSYTNNNWQGQLTQLNLKSKKLGHWQLNKPVQLAYGQAIQVSPFCWQSQHGKICADLNYQTAANWKINVTLHDFNLAMLQDFLPETIEAHSDIDAAIHLATNQKGAARGTLNLELNSVKLDMLINQNRQQLHFINSHLNATLDKNGLHSQLKLIDTQDRLPVSAQLSLPNYQGKGLPSSKQKITGSLKANWPSLQLLEAFIPQVDKLAGQLNAHFKVAGTLGKPVLNGSIKLNKGFVELSKLGLKLTPINLKLAFDGSNQVKIDGEINSNGKPLKLQGNASIGSGFSPATLNLTGQDIPIINNSEYKIHVSPDLTINYSKPKLSITGEVHIPYARLTPKDFTSTTAMPSSVTYVGETKKEPAVQTHVKVKVTLGKKISLSYAGLSAKLDGGVTVEVAPNELTTASGTLNVTQGDYKAYGEHLTIQNGTLVYTGGSIANPGINILATKTIKVTQTGSTPSLDNRNITVGVQATGTIDTPKISLYSSPGMSNNDKLSYLLFGQASNEVSGGEFQLISKAASAIGVFGNSEGGGIIDSLQEGLGLNQLGVESSQVANPENSQTQQNSSFVVGKQITKAISVSYSVGILIPVNILSIRYQPFKNWAIETDASTYGSGADILYTFERD